MQFLHQMFNVSTLLLATPLTNGAINETLRQFAPLNDDRLLLFIMKVVHKVHKAPT